jgi:hypothetical protein
MSSLQIVSTAPVLGHTARLAGSGSSLETGTRASFKPLEWLIDLTEFAQRVLARSAQAEALVGGRSLDDASRFVSDAAGGGCRSFEAARALRAHADRP